MVILSILILDLVWFKALNICIIKRVCPTGMIFTLFKFKPYFPSLFSVWSTFLISYFMTILDSLSCPCLLIPCPVENLVTLFRKGEMKDSICRTHFPVKETCPLLWHEEDLRIFPWTWCLFFLSYISFLFVCVYASLVSIAVWPWCCHPTVFTISKPS